ncbi:MAG: ABC transporter ATP-binding protein [Candidatus Dormibacteria bacterium]
MSVAAAPPAPRGLDVECDRVVLLYPSEEGDVAALRGIDLEISAGEALAILGPSGSGKSSLLALLAGLIKPSSGRVRLGEHDLGQMTGSELARLHAGSVSLVLQDPTRNLLPYASAVQNVEFAQRLGTSRRHLSHRPARELLEMLGLGELGRRQVASLSGGEQQQVAIAASISLTPSLLLVDEPTNQLDAGSRDLVMRLLLSVNQELGTTLVCVTHDQAVADKLPRTVHIRDGLVGAEGRLGENYSVVSRDGSVQLPKEVLDLLPPGTLIKVVPRGRGAELINPDRPPAGGPTPPG